MHSTLSRLQSDALKCRDLASTAMTDEARDILIGLAAKYEETLDVLDRDGPKRPARPAFHWPLP